MLVGYTDQISLAPGEALRCMVSTDDHDYEAQLVAIGGVESRGPHGTHRETLLPSPANGRHRGRLQPIDAGSHVQLPLPPTTSASLTVELSVFPTHRTSTIQTLVHVSAGPGFPGAAAVTVDPTGQVVSPTGDGTALPLQRWTRVTASVEVAPGLLASGGALLLGASAGPGGAEAHFNGRVADPQVRDADGALLGAWDFSLRMDADVVVATGGPAGDGILVNRPARAVLGPHWDRRSLRWTDAPEQWNAVHLHDDDLDDAGWESDVTFEAPRRSGIYAVRLRTGDEHYYLPFFVRAQDVHERVLVVLPTNTYLAYANEHLWEGERGDAHQKMMAIPIQLDRAEQILSELPAVGRSLYDRHSDGSGVMYASRRRPLTNWQPDYVNWLAGGRRHLSADLFITGLLEHHGIGFDVATDEDVDRDSALLQHYDVVLSGSHPEYPTENQYDAIQAYVDAGGRFMYLGANGWFWVTSFTDSGRDAIEVRRGFAAQRNWTSHPAEVHHSSTGEMGAAWMHRGRDQPPLFGIGMAAAGWGPGSGYLRSAASHDPSVSWVFDGVESEIIGEHGYALGGAAGDELDHADPLRGTPEGTTVLASSRHGDLFNPTLETVTEVGPGQSGSQNDRVRADLVLVQHPGGGLVFSTGSICWAASIGTNDYDNDVARVTLNVLRRFLGQEG